MEQNVSDSLASRIWGHINTLKKLIKGDESTNCPNLKGYTPLHLAVTCGDEKRMKELILTLLKNKNYNLNSQDKNGQTAMHYLAGRGLVDTAKLLVKHGADVNIADNNNNRPIDCAIYECDEEAVSYFLSVGGFYPECTFGSIRQDADPDLIQMLIPYLHDIDSVRNSQGETLLHAAVQFFDGCIAKILMDNDASVNTTCTLLNETTLHKFFKAHHIGGQHLIVLSALLDRLPNISTKTVHGHTPFDVFKMLKDRHEGCIEPDLEDIFFKYVCKLYAARLFNLLNPSEFDKITNFIFPKMLPYYNECVKEVKHMKTNFIEEVSLYSMLTRSPESLVRLLKNDKIYQALNQNMDGYLSPIPCYKSIMEVKFKRAMDRAELVKGCQTFCSCFNLPNLPPHIVDDILEYLTKLELISLKEVCRRELKDRCPSLKLIK